MSNISSVSQERLLPTYRWNRPKSLSAAERELQDKTAKLLLDFRANADGGSRNSLPPADIIEPIVAMNVGKRTAAIKNAEEMIARSEIKTPSPSLIPTFMAAGHEIRGVEDDYMKHDHPSQEIFAYNRLGKSSWLNKRFGEHCLTAIGFAHPQGEVVRATQPTRVKAHRPTSTLSSSVDMDVYDDWVVVSSKTPIATIHENDRKAALISRVTGAVDLSSPRLSHEETDAIVQLSRHESVFEYDHATIVGQKALLLDALERYDNVEDSPFFPVIQTVYITQIH